MVMFPGLPDSVGVACLPVVHSMITGESCEKETLIIWLLATNEEILHFLLIIKLQVL